MAKSPVQASTPKRRGRKPASAVPQTAPDETPVGIVSADPSVLEPVSDPASGSLVIPHDDGSIIVDFNPPAEFEDDFNGDDPNANLARGLPDAVLSSIAEELLDGINADEDSRSEWIGIRTRGLDMLGLKVEDPASSVSASSAPLEGMSRVRDPLMLEAVLRFQANAQGEMLPASGPVKVVDYGDGSSTTDGLATALEKDLNFYLTSTATEYYPDSRRMYFETGFSGMAFKKVYRCPLRRRPVSEMVSASDLIVSNDITDLRNASRITHQITMRPSVMKRMQILGVYRDVELQQPQPDPDPIKDKVNRIQGIQSRAERPQDQSYTVFECYCELDIPGFEHKDEQGNETGLPLPYRVTIEKDSRQILEIHRNWAEDDEDYLAKIPFVAFPYVTGLGFYGIGMMQILGNLTNALTALTREGIDSGLFANFPGFLIEQAASRQMTNQFRVAPGGGLPVDTGGKAIKDAIMPLPYKEMGAATIQLTSSLRDLGQRLGGTADTPVGEGKQDAPVGTTLALIEQATKVEGAVHKALHAAQAEEFRQLCELFREDPESLWRNNKRPALAKDVAKFMDALDRCDVVPQADPNVASQMQRVMTANAIRQMAQTAPPGMYNMVAIEKRCLDMMKVENTDDLFMPPQAPPAPPQPDPLKIAELQVKNKVADTNRMKVVSDAENKKADRESKQNIEVLKLAQTAAVHPESAPVVDQQINALGPFLTPDVQGQKPQQLPALPRLQPQAPPRPAFVPPRAGLGGMQAPFLPPRTQFRPPMGGYR